MDTSTKLENLQPRSLRYRNHYKIYFMALMCLSGILLSYWGYRLSYSRWNTLYAESAEELWASFAFFGCYGVFYFGWLKSRMWRSVQVFPSHLLIKNGSQVEELKYEDIDSVAKVWMSVFYFKMKNGGKYYFSSSLERVDYIWEGFYEARSDLISKEMHEAFRLKLVQYDHHQKRKEWFFKHKLIDVLNWVVAPAMFLLLSYAVQSRDVLVHHQGMYFFRLFMYSVLVMLTTTFFYSILLKKLIFDKKIMIQMSGQSDDKLRDLEYEGVVLQRSKIMQMVTAGFVFGLLMKSEVNLFSITKIREDLTSFNMKAGQTLIVDNRYNCIQCKYPVRDGDLVVFGRGTIGQIMATEGDMVGQISQDKMGRMIASENIQEVPKGHIAIKLANQKEMVFVKIDELIGKLQK